MLFSHIPAEDGCTPSLAIAAALAEEQHSPLRKRQARVERFET